MKYVHVCDKYMYVAGNLNGINCFNFSGIKF